MIAAWMIFSIATGCAFTLAAIAADRFAAIGRQARRFIWFTAMAVTTCWPAITFARSALFPIRDSAGGGLLPVSGAHRLNTIIVSAPIWNVSPYWTASIVLTWGALTIWLIARFVFAIWYIRRSQHRQRCWAGSDRDLANGSSVAGMGSHDEPAAPRAHTSSRGRTPKCPRSLSAADRHFTHGSLPVESGTLVPGASATDRHRDRLRQPSTPHTSTLA